MGGSGANNGDLSKTFEWFEPSEVLKDEKSAEWDFFKLQAPKAEGPGGGAKEIPRKVFQIRN